jgi:hypothetical protein
VCLTSSHLGRLGTGFSTDGNKRGIHFGSTVGQQARASACSLCTVRTDVDDAMSPHVVHHAAFRMRSCCIWCTIKLAQYASFHLGCCQWHMLVCMVLVVS